MAKNFLNILNILLKLFFFCHISWQIFLKNGVFIDKEVPNADVNFINLIFA